PPARPPSRRGAGLERTHCGLAWWRCSSVISSLTPSLRSDDRRVVEQVRGFRWDGHRFFFREERSVRRSGGRSGRALTSLTREALMLWVAAKEGRGGGAPGAGWRGVGS